MNKVKIGASQIETVRTYIQKKFEDMNSAFYPSYMRRGKCIAYYLAAQGTPWGQMVIKEKYLFIYREAWPHGEVAAAAAAASAGYQPRAHNEKHEARARISTNPIENCLGFLGWMFAMGLLALSRCQNRPNAAHLLTWIFDDITREYALAHFGIVESVLCRF